MNPKPFPSIDGHFWIEINGEIIDNYFKEYDFVKSYNNCSGDMIYKEADKLTQTIIIEMFKRSLTSMGLNYETFIQLCHRHNIHLAKVDNCYQNCLLFLEEGDILKFGSMGWKRKIGPEIHWEYGGKDWVGAKTFLK
jgi:hypothetical protein